MSVSIQRTNKERDYHGLLWTSCIFIFDDGAVGQMATNEAEIAAGNISRRDIEEDWNHFDFCFLHLPHPFDLESEIWCGCPTFGVVQRLCLPDSSLCHSSN